MRIDFGVIDIGLHRTVRVRSGGNSWLPPSLGHFPVYKVSDYKNTCPKNWEDDAVFIAMHDKEAMWISFDRHNRDHYEPPVPVAIMVGAGGVNALDGEKLGEKLGKDNYMVSPPQPWLDGWKEKNGTVYQFVATNYRKGNDLTIGEQILGEECKTGGIKVIIFEAKNPEKLINYSTPAQQHADDDSCEYSFAFAGFEEMGVGKGGKINQKIYPDPYGIEVWNEKPTKSITIYLVDAKQFAEITGTPLPPLPKSAEDYMGIWYSLKDENEKDISGTDKFTELKSVLPTAV